MRFANELPEVDPQIHENLISQGWKTINEPQDLRGFVLKSIPFMVSNLALSLLIIGYFSHWSGTFSFRIRSVPDFILSLIGFLVVLFLFPALHELFHLILIPGFWKSDKTLVGIIAIGAFVYTEEIISKRRYCILSMTPFILISVVLNIILGYMGLYNFPVLAFILFNAFGSCVDMLSLFLLMSQVPKGAIVVNNGIRTYYRDSQYE